MRQVTRSNIPLKRSKTGSRFVGRVGWFRGRHGGGSLRGPRLRGLVVVRAALDKSLRWFNMRLWLRAGLVFTREGSTADDVALDCTTTTFGVVLISLQLHEYN